MGARVLVAEIGAALMLILAALAAGLAPRHAPPAMDALIEPGGRAADVALAVNDPDEYAWRLFLYLNRQAAPGAAGVADPGRSILAYQPDAPVVWETWPLVSGDGKTQAGSEVLPPNGAAPVAWPALSRAAWPAKRLSVRLSNPEGPAMLEVRINRASYDFIRARGLYNVAGLQRLYAEAQAAGDPDAVRFPIGAKAVKAVWRDLGANPPAALLARYHWRRIGGRVFGLTGLHIATRDLPTWFWADFEHVDDPLPPGEPSQDLTTRGPSAAARGRVDGERRELIGSKWAYYRLRGAQIGFVDARGAPTRLSDAMLEQGFEHTSCITCHARATIRFEHGRLTALGPNPANFDDADARPPALADAANTDLGAPRPGQFGKRGLDFLQTDFVWSLAVRAPREVPGGRLVPRP
ncbi:MAG TPA: hypothetical protein VKT30_19890 [Caulobacteraceae bacterium]|nr:hypothetical protein [Caulobacteraceae bacterium]